MMNFLKPDVMYALVPIVNTPVDKRKGVGIIKGLRIILGLRIYLITNEHCTINL